MLRARATASLLLVLALALAPVEQTRNRQLEAAREPARRGARRAVLPPVRGAAPRTAPLAAAAGRARAARVEAAAREQVDYLFDLLRRVSALDAEQRLFDYVLVARARGLLLAACPARAARHAERRPHAPGLP